MLAYRPLQYFLNMPPGDDEIHEGGGVENGFSLEKKAVYVSSPPGALRNLLPLPRPPNPHIVENALTLAPRSSSWLSVTGVVGISGMELQNIYIALQKSKKGSTPPPSAFLTLLIWVWSCMEHGVVNEAYPGRELGNPHWCNDESSVYPQPDDSWP